jgi:hypothetical protein
MANAKKEVEQTTEQTTEQATETKEAVTKYLVKVTDNPNYCGIGAGGVQFANGQAVIESARMAEWFNEHKGYTVEKQ